jgi:hypothetical protein
MGEKILRWVMVGLFIGVIVSLGVITVVWCTGCAHQPRGPLGMHANGVDNSDVGYVVTYVVNEIGRPLPRGWRIVLIDKYIGVPTGDVDEMKFADGFADKERKQVTVTVYDDCLATSSLIHELLHVYGYEHDVGMQALEKWLVRGAVDLLCGRDYVPTPSPEPTNDNYILLQEIRR